jgi:hypothetical protein
LSRKTQIEPDNSKSGLDEETDPALLPAWLVQAIVEKPAVTYVARRGKAA